MKDSRKLWVDLGSELDKSTGLRFQLRITSAGQPFGYRPDAPNQKIELKERQEKWKEWRDKRGVQETPQHAFVVVTGRDIIGAGCAIPLADICNSVLTKNDLDGTISEFLKEGASEKTCR